MIAARSGVSKATIYRRWPSRNALILDAVTIIHRPSAKRDTGSIRGDLIVLLKGLVQFLNRKNGGTVYMAFLNEAIRNPKIAKANEKITAEVRDTYVQTIQKAIERGELKPDTDIELMIDLLISPFIYRRWSEANKIDAKSIEPVIDAVLKAFGTK